MQKRTSDYWVLAQQLRASRQPTSWAVHMALVTWKHVEKQTWQHVHRCRIPARAGTWEGNVMIIIKAHVLKEGLVIPQRKNLAHALNQPVAKHLSIPSQFSRRLNVAMQPGRLQAHQHPTARPSMCDRSGLRCMIACSMRACHVGVWSPNIPCWAAECCGRLIRHRAMGCRFPCIRESNQRQNQVQESADCVL